MRFLKTVLLLLVVLALAAGATVAALAFLPTVIPRDVQQAPVVSAWPVATSERTVPRPPPTSVGITISVVGDLMTHSPQFPAARTADGSYDFTPAFEPVASRISAADLAMGNLETVLGGADLGYTGYPMFNAPDSFAEALAGAGFDVLTTANNHALDKGPAAAKRTLDVLDGLGVRHTGTARSAEERDEVLLIDVNGVSVAIIAYTYGMNGFRPPADEPWLVNEIDEAAMVADVKAAAAAGADVIVACIHNGLEYQRFPSPSQDRLARAVIDAGADVVFGSHPHVIQPMEVYDVTRADGTVEQAFIIHSLGNFISNQRPRFTDTGVIVTLAFKKDLRTGLTTLEAVEYVPTWVDVTAEGRPWWRVLPLGQGGEAEYTDISTDDRTKMRQAWTDTTSHLGGKPGASEDPAAVVFYTRESAE